MAVDVTENTVRIPAIRRADPRSSIIIRRSACPAPATVPARERQMTASALFRPDWDRMATLCSNEDLSLVRIVGDLEDFMDCDAIHGVCARFMVGSGRRAR
ncbi:hypothetical protein TVNIR_1936 [Thioalkalivibrio nitratireducens DSM 14787]|uniref:Uncharacterized protein n=1 Tax=Thioalkalivibrio nitratireducens (strain DSM 14787 / UNIQEM 213 / ALEN2) TaxID=1255043 RepID=L0DX65_THIND|nr:hypothetical protein [Thioalkalivibrio nitratireducens]AGA33597.1 hypothetical protein TVNIR_1936 [Thioalkalivibrio nitratireducens DSM 14787]